MKRQLPDELMFLRNRKLPQKHTDESMKGKVVVISGGTSGIGRNAVEHLAQGGAEIVIVARNKAKAQQAKQEITEQYHVPVSIYIADFSNLKDVQKAAKQIIEDIPRIDVLINSAGIHNTKKEYNKDGIEMVFCVNHLAPFLFTYLLLDKMKQSAPSRIIQVSSEGHRFNGLKVNDLNWHKRIYTGLRSYGASKTAQLLTVWEMDQQLKGTGVTINAMHPGDVRTNIGQNNGWLYRFFLRHITWHFLKDVNISGDALYYLSAAKEMEHVSGKFFHLTIEEVPAKHARNKTTQQIIWNKSLEMTGLQSQTK